MYSTEKRVEFAIEFRNLYINDKENLIKNYRTKKVDINFLADSFGCWGEDNSWKVMIEKASKTYSKALDKEMKKYYN